MTSDPLREQLARVLDWGDAHADFETIAAGVDPEKRGSRPAGLPYSPWELLEHLRLTQRDILDFCRDPGYSEPRWPDDYWPRSPAPGTGEWDTSLSGYRADLHELQRMARDAKVDLFARIPHGHGQTYLRELLLVADHTAYHLGQMVAVRRLLDDWPGRTS